MKANENKILTIAGKKVVVRYARTQEDACASCAFCSRKECHDLDCNMRDIVGESVCKYSYFVGAEEGKILPKLREFLATATPEELEAKYRELEYLLAPKDEGEDEDEAAEKAAYKYYPNSPSSGQFGTGDYQPEEDNSLDREVFVKGFKAGLAYERERLMKEAPVADVVEMHGNTEKGYQLELTLGFQRLPNIEYHGGKVRVIIEEIKEAGK